MAKLTAMFMVRNDLPLPGLNEVTMMTFDVLSLPVINSRLVRNTRNASLMMSRLPSLTTTALTSCGFFPNILFFFLVNSGISPMNGTVTLSRSFLPRTRVFIFSRMKIMTIGRSSPRANATIKMFLRTGDVGNILPCGGVTMRVL